MIWLKKQSSHSAGLITLKLRGIDQGNSVSVLVGVRGRMIQDSLFIEHIKTGSINRVHSRVVG